MIPMPPEIEDKAKWLLQKLQVIYFPEEYQALKVLTSILRLLNTINLNHLNISFITNKIK